MEGFLGTFPALVSHIYFVLVSIFAVTSFHSFALNFYFVKAFKAKERSEIHRYLILLNVLQLFIVGIVVAKCVSHTFWICLLV